MSALSPEARELLEASRSAGGPTSAQRAAMKHAVLAAVALPGSAAAAGAGGVKAAGIGLAAKLGIAVVAVCVGAGGVLGIQAAQQAEPAQLAAVVESVKSREPSGSPTAGSPRSSRAESGDEGLPLAPKAAPPSVEPPGVERVPGKAAARPPPALRAAPSSLEAARGERGGPAPEAPERAVVATPVVDEATLSREIAALSGAMGAVDGKRFGAALEQLTAYRAEFPARVLDTEASVVEVLALCGLGRVDEARAAAQSLPTNNPAVRRLERSCIAAGK